MKSILIFSRLFALFLQIKLLFQTGFDEAELKSYIPVIHANVYQTIKVCNIWKGVLVISLSAWFEGQMILSKNLKRNLSISWLEACWSCNFFECLRTSNHEILIFWCEACSSCMFSWFRSSSLLSNSTCQVLHDGSKELAQNDKEFSKYVLCSENKVSVQRLIGFYVAWVLSSQFMLTTSGWKKELV